MFEKKDLQGVNRLYTDFRGDVIAAGAVDNGFEADKVIVLRRSGTEHQTDKEIDSVEYKLDYEGNGNDVLLLKTNRRGIYDNLPEGVFHTSLGLRNQSKETIVNDIRRQHKDEFHIRRFFSLYEAEVERVRVDVRLAELRYDRPNKHRSFVDTLSRFWPTIRQMDTQTAVLFARSIPHLSDIRNRYGDIARAMTTIIGQPIRITLEQQRQPYPLKYPRLGAMRLGVNSVLRGNLSEPCAVVTIKPAAQAVKAFLPQAARYRIVEALLEIFMPEGVNYWIVVRPERPAYTSRVGDRTAPAYLGVNARLKVREEINYES